MDINMNEHNESDDTNGDGEGVWSPDIEQCFREALILFPPCGRRKHILQEEGGGKMYGRNELIARHIMMRTGKSRTRKQVSSHIQVLARRKAKAEAASSGAPSSPALSQLGAGGVGGGEGARGPSGISPLPSSQSTSMRQSQAQSQAIVRQQDDQQSQLQQARHYDDWADRPIVTQKIRLVEFSAFIEHRNFQTVTATVNSSDPIGHSNQQQTLLMPSTTSGPDNSGTVAPINTTDPDLCLQQSAHMQARYQAPDIKPLPHLHQTTHPLASNHHLPAQFNQATNYQDDKNQIQAHQHHHPHHLHQKSHPLQGQTLQCSHLIQQPQSSSGFTRHSYIQIDYTQTMGRQTNKLERIDINQIQDKFPEIGGSEGLFQRGPSDAFFLVKFWADLNNDFEYNIDDQNSYFGFSCHFETVDQYRDITCSTKACSYGLQVVEKVEKIYGALNKSNGRYSYDINRSPMCEFMIQFIKKLRQLPRASQMNSVLENFTVLQVITSESTSEILLCLAYVFEVASSDQNNGPQYHVYKLTKD